MQVRVTRADAGFKVGDILEVVNAAISSDYFCRTDGAFPNLISKDAVERVVSKSHTRIRISTGHGWYLDAVGNEFNVLQCPDKGFEAYYQVSGFTADNFGKLLLLKSDCVIIHEHLDQTDASMKAMPSPAARPPKGHTVFDSSDKDGILGGIDSKSLSNSAANIVYDPVNNPKHYTDGKIEVIDFIMDKQLGFHLGNTVKYIARAGKKDPTKTLEDLKKAQWYLTNYIESLKNGQ